MVARALRCECGFEARADDEDGLVEAVQRHAWDAHGMGLSRHEALALAFRAEIDEGARLPLAHRTTDREVGKEER